MLVTGSSHVNDDVAVNIEGGRREGRHAGQGGGGCLAVGTEELSLMGRELGRGI